MDASHDGKCYKDADEHTGLQRETTINIQIALLGGQTLHFETHFSATVSDIKALIHEQLGHHPRVQTLTLDTTILADSSALLKDVAVSDGSLLSLTVSNEPLGQSLLTEIAGKMMELSRWNASRGVERIPTHVAAGSMEVRGTLAPRPCSC